MLHHHHHQIPQNQLQRDPNRLGQPHRMVQASQQRGQPIMLAPAPSTGMLVPMPSGGVQVSVPPPAAPAVVSVHVQQAQQPGQQQQQQTQQTQQQSQQPAPIPSGHSQQSVPSGLQTQSNTGSDLDQVDMSKQQNSTSSTATNLANTKEKTPMCLVNELARYNKITHQYRLTGEQGPAHKKRFTVTLKLGAEEYEAEGPSIKKAQHAAASDALAKTKFKHPPSKTTRNLRMGTKTGLGHLTPTVELNALAMKRGEMTTYMVEVSNLQPNGFHQYHRTGQPQPYQQGQPRYNGYDARRNYGTRPHYNGHYENQRYQNYNHYGNKSQPNHSGWHSNQPGHVGHGETYTVRLRVGPREFVGEGATAQAARHDAAARALHELRQLPLPETATDGSINNVNVQSQENGLGLDDPNTELKSPISLVHEIALKRNLDVIFEVQSEKGPPHMKVFVTTCRVGEMVTEGEGNGKKVSKKRAAEKMLDELKKLPPLSPCHMIGLPQRLKRKPAVTKKKNRSLIKVYQEKTEPDYVEDINPISRLIQIQQAKKEKEPDYTLIEERGAPRRREFVMEVTVNGQSATGTGPNKKLAKRAAAEALLQQLGYSQPTNQNTNTSANKSDNKQTSSESNVGNISNTEKARKVTFIDDNKNDQPQSQPAGGSCGRQLVPGLLLMGDQSNTSTFSVTKSNVNLQTTATIAKEFLKAGNSPTADALAKAGHSQKMLSQSQQIKSTNSQVIRPKDQLLYLSQLLGFQVQFSDFPKANHEEFLTLLSLSTDPPQVCHGAGDTTDESHDQAALTALRVLSEMGLDHVAPNKKEMPSSVEGVHNPKRATSGNRVL